MLSNKLVTHNVEATRYEIGYVVNSNFTKAILSDDIHIPSFQKTWVSFIDKMSINLYNKDLKIFSENKSINQRILLRQKDELSIKPTLLNLIYFYHLPLKSEDPSILS